MGKVRTNVAFKGFSNNIDGLIYYERKGKTYVRMYSKPSNPNTPKQRKIRDAFLQLIKIWKQIGGIVHTAWRSNAKKDDIPGYAAFIGSNSQKQQNGEMLELCREYGVTPLISLSAKPGKSSGEIICEFAKGEVSNGNHVTFFAQRKENMDPEKPLVRIDAGSNAESPYSITGLVPGAEYFIYALVTDAVYDKATAVSESRSAVAFAEGVADAEEQNNLE